MNDEKEFTIRQLENQVAYLTNKLLSKDQELAYFRSPEQLDGPLLSIRGDFERVSYFYTLKSLEEERQLYNQRIELIQSEANLYKDNLERIIKEMKSEFNRTKSQ